MTDNQRPSASRRVVLAGLGTAAALASLPAAIGQAAPPSKPVNPPQPRGKGSTPGALAKIPYGTYQYPFAPTSLWNSVPVNPVLGDYQIPKTPWYPQVGRHKYSIGIFKAVESDPPRTILGETDAGIWDPSAQTRYKEFTLPHFPEGVYSGDGTDGAIAIHDQTTGIIWSFYKFRKGADGIFRSKQVSWTREDGSGMPDPDHYFLGACAGGTPNSGGQIRPDEYNQREAPMYYHAFYMTLDKTAFRPMLPRPPGNNWPAASVWPATQSDATGGEESTGQLAIGQHLLLPADFDVESLPSREIRKIARTLQTYGAYVMDRNFNTGFAIGVDLTLEDYDNADTPMTWEEKMAAGIPQSLDKIRENLRPLNSCDGYQTAAGPIIKPIPGRDVDLFGFRYPFEIVEGKGAKFNTLTRRLEFSEPNVVVKKSGGWQHAHYAILKPGEQVVLTGQGSSSGTIRMQVYSAEGKLLIDSGELRNGRKFSFTWPAGEKLNTVWTARSGRTRRPSWVDCDVRRA